MKVMTQFGHVCTSTQSISPYLSLIHIAGIIPYDGIANNKTVSVALPITVIFSILSLSGIVFALLCLIFIVKYRKSKYVILNNIILNEYRIIMLLHMFKS